MATLSLTIFKAKALKDGRHKIRIALRHKHETTYIVTRFIISENQFKNGQVVKHPEASAINRKLRNILDDLQDKLDSIKHLELYSCRQIKEIISTDNLSDEQTFSSACSNFVDYLKSEGRDSYALSIERVGRYFRDFARGDILLSDLTPSLVQNFAAFIRKRKVTETTVNTMLAQMKSVINRAIREWNISYDIHPFVTTRISAAPIRKLDLTVQSFNKIRESSPEKRKLIMARDLFCLSFYLGGMNLIDIMQTDFRKDVLEYSRSKTKGRMQSDNVITFTIPSQAREIICRWMDKRTGKLDFGYKFTYHNFSQYVTYSLGDLAEELNIDERVTFYSARKSFAQYASEIGIPDGIIDYCLGHSDKSKGVIRYYTKVRQKQADMAISRVIDYVDNPEKYKEYIELRSDIMMMRG
ncbi:site-specific integrase [Phocaeicola plebeius]|jgi:integrase|uniref:site-specific integrase n=1 Tax=Phocaeicola plebeius TaxID=310297 RepID=UPI0026F1E291|nr:site-specific integrase [Phocaeicola plebeius]